MKIESNEHKISERLHNIIVLLLLLLFSGVIGMLIHPSMSYINDHEALLIIIISVIIFNALIYFFNFKFTVLSSLLGSTYLIVALLGFYMIGIQIYMSTLYFNDIFSFAIISIAIYASITYVIIRNALMYFFNFKFTRLSSFLGLIFFILGLILFASSSHSWNHEVDKYEQSRIQHLYDEVKENPKLEKLFKTKLDEAKKDNIILQKEYYALERIYKYSFRLADSNKYVGDLVKGLRTGKGTFYYASGNKYVGDFIENQFHGKGTFYYADGDKYVGDFIENQFHGKGTFYHTRGDKYVGDYVKGLRTGKGTLYFASGDKYVGDFVKGRMTGKGTLYYANGDKYVGDFVENNRFGKGTYYYASGNKYVGNFIKDRMTGKGKYYLHNKRKWINLYNGKPE